MPGSARTDKAGPSCDGVAPYPGYAYINGIRDFGGTMAAQDRMLRYKSKGGAAGLVRVEVLVPPDDRRKILDLATRLRVDHRRKAMETGRLAALFDEAVTRYGTRCLWNVKPQPTPGGMLVIADKLRKHGDMEAWKLAARIREALDDAA